MLSSPHLPAVRVEWTKDSGGRWKMEEVPGSEKFFPAQLVFLALGFLGPQAEVIKALGVAQDVRSNIQTPYKVRFAQCSIARLTYARNIPPTLRVFLRLGIVVVDNR